MSALFLELARTVLLLSSSRIPFILRMISLMVVLAPHGEVAKALPLARLDTHNILVSVDLIVGLELLATTPADKQMARVLSTIMLVRHWQRLESLVTDITEENPFFLLCFVLLCSTSS